MSVQRNEAAHQKGNYSLDKDPAQRPAPEPPRWEPQNPRPGKNTNAPAKKEKTLVELPKGPGENEKYENDGLPVF